MRKKCNKWCKNAPQKPHKCVNTPISGKKQGKNLAISLHPKK